MAALKARRKIGVGLDGRPVYGEVRVITVSAGSNEDENAITMRTHDSLPKWARNAMAEGPLSFRPDTLAIAPHIHSGAVNRFNVHEQLRLNDIRLRRQADGHS